MIERAAAKPVWIRRLARTALLLAAAGAIGIGARMIDVAMARGTAPAASMPAVVAAQAMRYRLIHFQRPKFYPVDREGTQVRTLEEEYAATFFSGFVCGPQCGISRDEALATDAYMAGVTYRRDHPEAVDTVMAGYAWRRVDVEGVWSRGQEKSAFTSASQPGEVWWVSTLSGSDAIEMLPRVPGNEPPSTDETNVRLVGYVSPKGIYGHLGAYDHKVLVVYMTR